MMIFTFYIIKHKHQSNHNSQYSPNICTITKYKFTFIYDQKEQRFKVHGIWPDECQECTSCSYPSCCNIENVIYTEPDDPTNFINTNWFQTETNNECEINENKVSLFQHEYYKHISCTNLKTTTNFKNLAETLYNKYYEKYVINNCKTYDQIWLNLDNNFNYIDYECH